MALKSRPSSTTSRLPRGSTRVVSWPCASSRVAARSAPSGRTLLLAIAQVTASAETPTITVTQTRRRSIE